MKRAKQSQRGKLVQLIEQLMLDTIQAIKGATWEEIEALTEKRK